MVCFCTELIFFPNWRQVHLIFKNSLHLKTSPVFLAGKSLEDPGYCWFGCCARAVLKNQPPSLYILPTVNADTSDVLTAERREISANVIISFALLLEVSTSRSIFEKALDIWLVAFLSHHGNTWAIQHLSLMGKIWQAKEWNPHPGCSREMQEAQVQNMLCLFRPLQILECVLTSFTIISPKPLKSIVVVRKLPPKSCTSQIELVQGTCLE